MFMKITTWNFYNNTNNKCFKNWNINKHFQIIKLKNPVSTVLINECE